MAYNFKNVVSCLLILAFFYCHAQDDEKKETVFITHSDPSDKVAPEFFFGQLSLSTPLRGNPYSAEVRADYEARGEEYKPTVLDYVLPNGLSAHIGFGMHYKSWIGISTNTGIDWIATEKIVSAPVYGSILLTPQIWEETNLYLQAGYGYSFALGRGDLSGAYQKYRLGIIFDNTGSIFLDVSMSNFPLHELEKVGSISLGIAITNFGL